MKKLYSDRRLNVTNGLWSYSRELSHGEVALSLLYLLCLFRVKNNAIYEIHIHTEGDQNDCQDPRSPRWRGWTRRWRLEKGHHRRVPHRPPGFRSDRRLHHARLRCAVVTSTPKTGAP